MGAAVLTGVDGLAAAIVALLLAFGIVMLAEWVAGGMQQVPGIGPWVAAHMVPALHTAQQWMSGKLDAAVTPVAAWMMVHWDRINQWTLVVKDFSHIATVTVGNIVTQQIPNLGKTVTAWAAGEMLILQAKYGALLSAEATRLGNDLLSTRADLTTAVAAERAAAAAALAATSRDLSRTFGHALTQVEARMLTLDHAATQARASMLTQIEKDVAAVNSTVAAADAALRTHAAALFQQTETDIAAAAQKVPGVVNTVVDAAAMAGLEHQWTDLTDAAAGVAGVAAGDLADLKPLLGQIAGSVPVDLAGVLTALGVSSVAVLKYVEKCGIPTCRNLADVGSFLSELVSAGEQTILLAFLLQAISHPKEAAREFETVVVPFLNDAAGTVRHLLGV